MPEPLASTSYVLDADLPWPEDDAGRGGGRFEAATLVVAGGRHHCELRRIGAGGAVLKTAAEAAAGEAVALELTSGQRRAGRVEWAGSGEIALAFDEPLDMVALINRHLVSQPAERRSMPRVELRALAHVKWAEHLVTASVRNISSAGLQIEGDELPPQGTLASIFMDGINLPPAEVVWRRDRLAGFEYFEELGWASLIAWVREQGRKPR